MEKLSLAGLSEDASRFLIFFVLAEGLLGSWLGILVSMTWAIAYWILAWEASQDREPDGTPAGQATRTVGAALSAVGGASGAALLLGWSARQMVLALASLDGTAPVASMPSGVAVLGMKGVLLGLLLVALCWSRRHGEQASKAGPIALVSVIIVGSFFHGSGAALSVLPPNGGLPWPVLLAALIAMGPGRTIPARPALAALAATAVVLAAIFVVGAGGWASNPGVPLVAAIVMASRLEWSWAPVGRAVLGPLVLTLVLSLFVLPDPVSVSIMGLAGLVASVDVCRRSVGCRLRNAGWWRPWPLPVFIVAALGLSAGVVVALVESLQSVSGGLLAGLLTWTFMVWVTVALSIRWQPPHSLAAMEGEDNVPGD